MTRLCHFSFKNAELHMSVTFAVNNCLNLCRRLLQNRSPNLPESSGAHVMNISRPMSFAELNEYAVRSMRFF